MTMRDAPPDVVRRERHLELPGDLHGDLHDGRVGSRFHYLWQRDNCWCEECRATQSGERRLHTADIPADIAPTDACVVDDRLEVRWDDGHASRYALTWLADHDYSRPVAPARPRVHWDSTLAGIPRFAHAAVVADPQAQAAYLDAVRSHGAALVTGTPALDGEVEGFAQTVGHVRETAFERIHTVRHDPAGYNVAHTPLELKPHTDLPSYHWPPSVQLLHFLSNDATGGESTLVDGWAVLRDLRRDDPASGSRHLQDVYLEYDDLMARRSVLAGTHRPVPSYAGRAS